LAEIWYTDLFIPKDSKKLAQIWCRTTRSGLLRSQEGPRSHQKSKAKLLQFWSKDTARLIWKNGFLIDFHKKLHHDRSWPIIEQKHNWWQPHQTPPWSPLGGGSKVPAGSIKVKNSSTPIFFEQKPNDSLWPPPKKVSWDRPHQTPDHPHMGHPIWIGHTGVKIQNSLFRSHFHETKAKGLILGLESIKC
jgi:hypothetical protein